MAKIRVHDLAKEVGKSNKDVIDFLTQKGYEMVTAVSVVPDSEIAGIRTKFGGASSVSGDRSDVKPSSVKEAAASAQAKEEVDADGKEKKKGFVRVFRSENATRQLQHRPKKPAQPKPAAEASAPIETAKPAHAQEATPAPKTETVNTQSVTSAPKAENNAAVTAKHEETPVVEKKEVSSVKTSAETAKPVEAKKETESPKAAPEAAKAEAPKTEEKPKEDTGFRNGRIIRNVGPLNRVPTQTSRPAASRDSRDNNSRDNRNGGYRGRDGQGQGGYRGRDGQGQGQGGYRGRDGQGQGQGGYRGNGQGQGGYRGNGQGQGGYRGQGQNQGQGGYRDRNGQNAGGGYRDRNDRSGQGQGGYRGQGQGQGGFRGNGQGQGQGGFRGNGQGQGRPGFGQGRPAFGQNRGAAPAARPADSGDGALAHKTTRDFRKDGKEKDRNKEERRDSGFDGANRPNGQKRQFNRIPKALQQRNKPQREEKKEEVVTEIKIPEKITIRDLAEKMKIQASTLIKELFMKGEMVTVNHELTYEKAEEIALERNILCEKEEPEDVIGDLLKEAEESEENMEKRPPVICVMGHVDHGKTSLLDAIRNTHVTDREAGGITQHIGAYMVSVNGEKLTFLDTPGHEAFTAMRMRGANATDIAVLVVAADDGVMPQTVEAINHAKAANTEIIVAVNKIDKPGANIDRVKQELSEYGLIAEDWGGETVFCPVSARTHEGIDNLLEMIVLTSELHELKANPDRKARGIVLEAKLDKGRGPVASILVQKGTLHQGDFIACGAASGKVRAMTDERGRRLQKATPSMPVEVIGLSSVPEAGEVLVSLDTDKEAKEFASVFVNEGKKNLIEETRTQMTLDDLYSQIKEGNLKELPIVVKADVQGSVEAVSQSLLKLSNEEVIVKIIHGGVGAISESDVSLAAASNAIIIGFNVRSDNTAKVVADNQKVDIHLYSIIYEAIEDVQRALNGMRAAVFEEKIQGHAEIRQIFKASGVGNIAGAYIKDGIFQRSSKIRVYRKEELIWEGALASLKRFKDDVKEVREGFECGFVFEGWGGFELEDTVEAYTMVEVPRT